MEREVYGPPSDRSALNRPKNLSGYLFDKQSRMFSLAFLILVSMGFPLWVFIEARPSPQGWIKFSLIFSTLLGLGFALSRIRQAMYWDDRGLVLWNFLSKLSYKKLVRWSELRSIQVIAPGDDNAEAYLEFHCLNGVYRSLATDKDQILKVKQSILMEQAKSDEGRAFIQKEFKLREKILADRHIDIHVSISRLNRAVLIVFAFVVGLASFGFWYYDLSKNPLLYSIPFYLTVVSINWMYLQLFHYEISWDDRQFLFTTSILMSKREVRLDRSKIVSIKPSILIEQQNEYSCLRIVSEDLVDDFAFAKRIDPTYAVWIEETLRVVIESNSNSVSVMRE